MDTQYIALVLSGLTLVVFLASAILIYRQLRLTEKTIRGNMYLEIIREASAINKVFIENPELAGLWTGVEYVGVEGDDTEIKEAWVITIMMDCYENIFFQREQGNIPDEMWARWSRHITNVFKNTKVMEQWNRAKGVYYQRFREFVDKSIYGD